MRIGVFYSETQSLFGQAFIQGLKRHGITPVYCGGAADKETTNLDLVVFWSHHKYRRRVAERFNASAYIVLERGFIGDRFKWTMVGINGLNGRADFNHSKFGGWLNAPPDRWNSIQRIERIELKPWKQPEQVKKAVIIGQVPGDASLEHVDIDNWYLHAANQCRQQGITPLFRSHPIAIEREHHAPESIEEIQGSLGEAFEVADLIITYSSNTGVLAAIEGVPVFVGDIGSMASHISIDKWEDLRNPITPNRINWLSGLAWAQWLPEEISSGLAWEHIGSRVSQLVENSTEEITD